jgi:hypothetical protein
VLLAEANGAAWISPVERAMQRLRVPLDVYRFDVELGGAEVAAAAHCLEMDGALLVRPDGFVAWHTEAAAEGVERTLEPVLCRLLCRTPSASYEAPKLLEQLILPLTLTNYNSVFMTSQQHADILSGSQ